jgi:hypothetical protein
LFFLLLKFAPPAIAAIGSALYLFQIAAPDMLYNIHFHPYLLVNFFLLTALNINRPLLKGLFLFFAGLTHEAVFVGMFFYGLLLWKQKDKTKFVYFIPCAIFFFLNVLSFFYYKTPSLLGKGDQTHFFNFFGNFILAPLYLVGMESSSLFFSVLRTLPDR